MDKSKKGYTNPDVWESLRESVKDKTGLVYGIGWSNVLPGFQVLEVADKSFSGILCTVTFHQIGANRYELNHIQTRDCVRKCGLATYAVESLVDCLLSQIDPEGPRGTLITQGVNDLSAGLVIKVGFKWDAQTDAWVKELNL